MKLKNFELEIYLNAWIDNVGWADTPERTLMNAMRDEFSLKHWFPKLSDFDYDEEFALKHMREQWELDKEESL